MMAQPRILAPVVIFDLDGTLYRTESSFVRTMHQVFARHRISYPGDAAILGMVGEPFAAFLEWLGRQGFADEPSSLGEEIAAIELEEIREHGALYDGVREGLAELARRGCALALCTNGDRRYVDAVLARGGIAAWFDALSTLEEGGRSKTERVGELVSRFRPRPAVVVGDRKHDLAAAHANGCRMIGAAYGYARDGELDASDALIASFRELLDIVGLG